jgi:hypothetical protein
VRLETALAPQIGEEEGYVFPLSPVQERLWFLDQLTPGLAAYNVPLAVGLRGNLAPGAMRAALAAVVRRHETLRTRFHAEGGEPVQLISPPDAALAAFALPVIDLRGLSGPLDQGDQGDPRQAEIARLIAAEAVTPFDLRRGPLLRARLLRAGTAEHLLLLTLHHIVSDRWSMGVLLAEVASHYAGEPLAPLPLQYADYAVWQRDRLSGGELARQLDHWRLQLAGVPPLQLPADLRRPAATGHPAGELCTELPRQLTDDLRQLSREAGTTLFMTLLAGFLVVMARHGDQDQFVVGTAVANRGRRELEGLIGFFVNILPLRADLSGDPSFRTLLARVRQVTLDAFAHQEVPFDRLVEELSAAPAGAAATPLVQVTFMLQNTPMPELGPPGLELEEVPAGTRFAKFDLSVAVVEQRDGLTAVWTFDAGLFLPATVERMARHLHRLLAAAAAGPDQVIWDLPLANDVETAAQLAVFNRDLQPPAPCPPEPARHHGDEALRR